MSFVSACRDRRRLTAVVSASIVLAFVAALAFTARAQAAETIYWDNYEADPDSVSFANIDGSGGGSLNLAGGELKGPEGMAYDTVTNRLFVATESAPTGGILAINLDGSGAGVFSAPGAVFEEPEGLVVDPIGRMIYWVNTKGGSGENGSIGWAKLDGSAGGLLNTTGATVDNPYRGISFDSASGRVFWSNSDPEPETISFANANNTGGGGNLDLTGAPAPEGITGFSIDPAGGRIYWLDNDTTERIGYASLGGGGGGEVSLVGATLDDPYGLAFDPSIGRLYWGNYGVEEARTNAIGFASLAGGVGGISPLTAPVDGPQDPVVLKSPAGTGAPAITRDAKKAPAALACPTGSWAADYPGSFVYQAPRTYGYQWLLNGAPIAGATASTFTATKHGSYTCTVTAANQTGTASQTSGPLTVKAAKVKLTVKPKKAKAKAGKFATFNVQALNQGDLQTKKAKVCVKVPKKAKKALKAPKCKSIGKVSALKKKKTKLKVGVKPSAEGSYKVKIQVKGANGKAVNATIKVIG
jgi:hypothetical protein